MPEKLLISACLLGHPVRYDGKSKPIADLAWLQQLQQQQRLFILCPEVAGGLPTPRAPAEIVVNRVLTTTNEDVTESFNRGAQAALSLCLKHGIGYALLKANSPSCGNSTIYDGSFSGTLKSGMGVTAKLLTQYGIKVFSECQLTQVKALFDLS